MSAIGNVLKTVAFGVLGSALLKKPKTPKAAEVAAPRAITTNDAVEAQRRDDERRRRRGIGANILTGSSGAEAQTSGGKVLLGQ